jgi:large subunit ribosomal protein L19
MSQAILNKVTEAHLKTNIPSFCVGDTIRVFTRIVEGSREREQRFDGIVIARNGGGIQETVTVRRISYGEGLERVFPLHSPLISKIEVGQRGDVRRAKLYYLRDRVGKKARVKQKRI